MCLLGPTSDLPLPTSKSFGFIALGLLGPTLGLLVPTSNSLGLTTLRLLVATLGLSCQRASHVGFLALGVLVPQRSTHLVSVLWAYSGRPWAYFCQRQVIWFYCSGPSRAHLPTFANERLLWAYSGLLWARLCQIANHIISLLWACSGLLGLPLPTSNSLGVIALRTRGPTLGLH